MKNFLKLIEVAFSFLLASALFSPPLLRAADTVPPTVSFTTPAANSILSGTLQTNVSALDNVGVTKVELYLDNVLTSTLTHLPYNATWNTLGTPNGLHTISAKAYDAALN